MVFYMKLPQTLGEFEEQIYLFQKKGFKLEEKINNQFIARKNKLVVYLTK